MDTRNHPNAARKLRCLASMAILALAPAPVSSEQVTMSTYYPSPSGVYKRLITTAETFLARDAGGLGIGLTALPAGSKLALKTAAGRTLWLGDREDGSESGLRFLEGTTPVGALSFRKGAPNAIRLEALEGTASTALHLSADGIAYFPPSGSNQAQLAVGIAPGDLPAYIAALGDLVTRTKNGRFLGFGSVVGEADGFGIASATTLQGAFYHIDADAAAGRALVMKAYDSATLHLRTGESALTLEPNGHAVLFAKDKTTVFNIENSVHVAKEVVTWGNLETKANLIAGNDLTVSGCANIGGVAYGTCYSDGTFKRNVASLDGTLDKIAGLRPVRYDWNPGLPGADGRQWGLIAQEVEAVLPELVVTKPEGHKAVNYGPLPLLAIEAVRELRRENLELKARLEALEAKLDARSAAPSR